MMVSTFLDWITVLIQEIGSDQFSYEPLYIRVGASPSEVPPVSQWMPLEHALEVTKTSSISGRYATTILNWKGWMSVVLEMASSKYSIILPTYNERRNLPIIIYLLNQTFVKQYVFCYLIRSLPDWMIWPDERLMAVVIIVE